MTVRRFGLPLLALLLLACSDTATDPTADDTADDEAAIRAALLIDPDALPSYVRDPLPAFYDANILAREDRTLGAPITDAGVTLGRVLFYERQLSRTGTISCASCHATATAFGDTARFSRGFEGALTTAHSMRLVNGRFNQDGRTFWDKRAPTLEAQTTQPIQDSGEMGFDAAHGGLTAALTRLAGLPYYPPLVRLAFGDSMITADRVQRALAQYVRAIISTRSRWDVAAAQVFNPANPAASINGPFPGFTAEEQLGKQVFQGSGCAACHTPPSFSLSGASRSNGLDEGDLPVAVPEARGARQPLHARWPLYEPRAGRGVLRQRGAGRSGTRPTSDGPAARAGRSAERDPAPSQPHGGGEGGAGGVPADAE